LVICLRIYGVPQLLNFYANEGLNGSDPAGLENAINQPAIVNFNRSEHYNYKKKLPVLGQTTRGMKNAQDLNTL
jgi:hypothetical protein